MSIKRKGVYLAKLLRHDPESLKIDKDGYILVSDILKKLHISKEDLDSIVETNDKKRFSYDDSGLFIRASQGHSKGLDIDIKMKLSDDVDFLYHGTATENIPSIMEAGLLSIKRKHVHLSKDILTAQKVGLRHSKDITILKVDAGKMISDGLKIYVSDNGVYLVDEVDKKYLLKK